jgi:CRP/FNR family transcriptional regulator
MKKPSIPSFPPVSNFALFQIFSPMEYARLENYCQPQTFKPGEYLFREGDPLEDVFLILKGHVKFCKKVSRQKELTFNLLGGGDVFELNTGGAEEKHLFSSGALSEVYALKIKLCHFREFFMCHSAFSNRLLEQKIRTIKELYFSRMVSTKPVEIRMAYFLLNLAKRPGMASAEGKKIFFEIPLTRRDIAEMVNTSVETSIRVIRQWMKKEWVSASKRRLVVKDIPAFRKMIAGLPVINE